MSKIDLHIQEYHTEKVLSPTAITIADYVINPYRGCAMGCQYCYAKRNKNTVQKLWGEFLDVKINASALLRREIEGKSIERVLLGSITEVYQNKEKDYRITRQIMEILNEAGIAATVLTRSPLIVRDLDLWSANPKHKVCFTVTPLADEHLRSFEYQSSLRAARIKAIKELRGAGVDVYAYVAPLLPGLVDTQEIFESLSSVVTHLDCEVFNGATMDIRTVVQIYQQHFPKAFELFKNVYATEENYRAYWQDYQERLSSQAHDLGYIFKFHLHSLKDFFQNHDTQYMSYQ